MAHYDLYKSLGLNYSDSSENLKHAIDSMLQSGQQSGTYANQGGKAELEIAREVLGNSSKREKYDAKLSDPEASSVSVKDLKALASMTLPEKSVSAGTAIASAGAAGASATASSAADTGEIPVAKGRQQKDQPEPPQYRQVPPAQAAPAFPPTMEAPQGGWNQYPPQPAYQQGYQQGYPGAYQQGYPQPAKKKNGGKIAAILLATVVVLAGIGAAAYFFAIAPAWKSPNVQLKQAFPNIVSARENTKGWNDLKCQGANPGEDQSAKILCGDDQTVVSVVKFDSAEDRAKYLPSEGVSTLDNGTCSVKSAEVPGNKKPTYALWPSDDEKMAILISSEDAENLRLQMPLCSS